MRSQSNDKVEVKTKVKVPAKRLMGKKHDSSPGPISDDPHADSGIESVGGDGGSSGGYNADKAGRVGDGVGLHIILLGRHGPGRSNMMKRMR